MYVFHIYFRNYRVSAPWKTFALLRGSMVSLSLGNPDLKYIFYSSFNFLLLRYIKLSKCVLHKSPCIVNIFFIIVYAILLCTCLNWYRSAYLKNVIFQPFHGDMLISVTIWEDQVLCVLKPEERRVPLGYSWPSHAVWNNASSQWP